MSPRSFARFPHAVRRSVSIFAFRAWISAAAPTPALILAATSAFRLNSLPKSNDSMASALLMSGQLPPPPTLGSPDAPGTPGMAPPQLSANGEMSPAKTIGQETRRQNLRNMSFFLLQTFYAPPQTVRSLSPNWTLRAALAPEKSLRPGGPGSIARGRHAFAFAWCGITTPLTRESRPQFFTATRKGTRARDAKGHETRETGPVADSARRCGHVVTVPVRVVCENRADRRLRCRREPAKRGARPVRGRPRGQVRRRGDP